MSVHFPEALPGPAAIAPDALNQKLQAVVRRIRGLWLLRNLSLALGVSALLGTLLVGLSKLRLYPTPTPWLVFAIFAVAMLVGSLTALLPRMNELDVARLTERRADLKERFSSALEFRQSSDAATREFHAAQMADASRHVAGIDPVKLFPARFPRLLVVSILGWLLIFLIYLLPTLPLFWTRDRLREAAEVKLRGVEIVKLANNTEKIADQQKLSETKKAAAEIKKLGEAMRKNRISKKSALVAQQKLTRRMEEQQRKLADQMPKKSLDQAGKEMKRSMDQMQQQLAREQQKQAQQTAGARTPQKPGTKPDGDQPKESETMKQLHEAMKQMQQAMQNQDPKQMQQAMQQMAQAMQRGSLSQQEMQQMQQAMQAMAQAMQSTQMQQASQQMAQMAQMAQSMNGMDSRQMQQLSAMMSRIAQGMGKASSVALASLDAKALSELMAAFKEGRMTLAAPGDGNGGTGGMGGSHGFGGHGVPSKAMKDPGQTRPRLQIDTGMHTTMAQGKNGSIAQFSRYLAMSHKGAKYQPNGQIKGMRSANGQELSQQMTGDPSGGQSNLPYYQAVETSRKQAESALSKESVPASMKQQVRDYFESIKP